MISSSWAGEADFPGQHSLPWKTEIFSKCHVLAGTLFMNRRDFEKFRFPF